MTAELRSLLCVADALIFHIAGVFDATQTHSRMSAAADTMATDTIVGIGGYIIFPPGVSGWFQLQLGPLDFQDIAPWATVPLQHNICAFELLGQHLSLQLATGLLLKRLPSTLCSCHWL